MRILSQLKSETCDLYQKAQKSGGILNDYMLHKSRNACKISEKISDQTSRYTTLAPLRDNQNYYTTQHPLDYICIDSDPLSSFQYVYDYDDDYEYQKRWKILKYLNYKKMR